eukprot:2023507-Rhodomonas_salina.1
MPPARQEAWEKGKTGDVWISSHVEPETQQRERVKAGGLGCPPLASFCICALEVVRVIHSSRMCSCSCKLCVYHHQDSDFHQGDLGWLFWAASK